jgi:hypothetical protein
MRPVLWLVLPYKWPWITYQGKGGERREKEEGEVGGEGGGRRSRGKEQGEGGGREGKIDSNKIMRPVLELVLLCRWPWIICQGKGSGGGRRREEENGKPKSGTNCPPSVPPDRYADPIISTAGDDYCLITLGISAPSEGFFFFFFIPPVFFSHLPSPPRVFFF